MNIPLIYSIAGIAIFAIVVLVFWYTMSSMTNETSNPNAIGRDGHPQIFEAIEDSDQARARRLITAGANIEARGYGQGTPILKAALTDNWIIAEMLLEAGADPMVPDEFGLIFTRVASRANLKSESDEGQALTRIRAILTERGLISLVFTPEEVRTMVEAGEWPPKL